VNLSKLLFLFEDLPTDGIPPSAHLIITTTYALFIKGLFYYKNQQILVGVPTVCRKIWKVVGNNSKS